MRKRNGAHRERNAPERTTRNTRICKGLRYQAERGGRLASALHAADHANACHLMSEAYLKAQATRTEIARPLPFRGPATDLPRRHRIVGARRCFPRICSAIAITRMEEPGRRCRCGAFDAECRLGRESGQPEGWRLAESASGVAPGGRVISNGHRNLELSAFAVGSRLVAPKHSRLVMSLRRSRRRLGCAVLPRSSVSSDTRPRSRLPCGPPPCSDAPATSWLRDVRRADTHALLFRCHDRALCELRTVATESGGTHRTLILRTQVHESHDASMWTSK